MLEDLSNCHGFRNFPGELSPAGRLVTSHGDVRLEGLKLDSTGALFTDVWAVGRNPAALDIIYLFLSVAIAADPEARREGLPRFRERFAKKYLEVIGWSMSVESFLFDVEIYT